MSEYILKKIGSNTDMPFWLIPVIEKAVQEQEKKFGVTLDRLIYHDYGGDSKYLLFKTEKRLKDYTFKISGQADVDKEKKTVSKFYAVRIGLIIDSDEIENFYEAYYLSNVNRFMEYAQTSEFDEYIEEIRKNKQLIKDLESRNKEIKDTIQEKLDNLEQN